MKSTIKFRLNGKKIRRLIASMGMSQTKFAEKAGISKTYVSLIVNNKKCVSPQMAKRIADKLQVKMNDIFLNDLFTNSKTKTSIT